MSSELDQFVNFLEFSNNMFCVHNFPTTYFVFPTKSFVFTFVFTMHFHKGERSTKDISDADA